MYRNSILVKGLFLVAASVLSFSSCRRAVTDDNYLSNEDDRIGYATDLSRIEFANNDVISMADQAGTIYSAEYIRKAGNKSVTVSTDTLSTPHVLIIRFGEKDVECADGRMRRGSIIIKYNGRYLDTSMLHTITFDNYHVNGNELSGWIKVTRIDTSVTGNWYYNVQVNDSLNVSPDPLQSKVIAWSGNLLRKWVSGDVTQGRADDYFNVSGNGTLTRPNGHVFSVNISAPLQFGISCDYAQSGVANITGFDGLRVLNYGGGNCDDDAQLNIGVHVYQLTLAK
jgi:hypothetical protein